MAKVLIVTRWYPSEENPVHAVFVKEFAKATALYNNVTVLYGELTTKGHPRWPYEICDQMEDGIRTIRFKYRRRFLKLHRLINLIASTHCLLNIVKSGERPDIVHFHVYLASLPAFVFAKLYRIPLVITEHYTGFVRGILTFLERLSARIIMNKATIVLPVSHHLRRHLQTYAPRAKFEVVYNIVDTSMFRPSSPITKSGNESKRMLMVGRLDPAKGVSYLLEALSLLKKTRTDFFLDILGDGTKREELEESAAVLELGGFVRFHGIKPKPQVPEYMAQCDFLVLPSLFETFGCVLIEALACGKPVVATNIGGPDEIVTDQSGILVPPGNAEALKDGINHMLDNYWTYPATDISNYVADRFSLITIGQKLDQIYDEIIFQRTK